MLERKNICITINSLVSGGAEKQSLLLAQALQPYHNTILVILNRQPVYLPRLKLIEDEGINHIYLSKNPIKKAQEFTSLLKKRKVDIIFSFLPTDTILSAICGKAAHVPYIFGGIRNSYMSWIKFTLLKIVNNNLLNYTIANNYAAYNSAIKFGFKNKVFVIHNGIEIRPISEKQKPNKKLITIISMGRLVKQKDYNTAIKSIAELKQNLNKNYKLKYKIVGQGPEQQNIIDTIKKFNVVEEVELITNPSDVYDLLESSNIYLCTSIFEGISNSIMEAMNCSLPIVATDAGDNSHLVIHGENGFITAIHDFRELANHMHSLIESPDMRHRMGLGSYGHLIKYFGYDAFQKNYLNIIKNIELIKIKDGKPKVRKDHSIKMY